MKVIKDRTCRGDIIVYFNVNLKLLTKLINIDFVGELTSYFVVFIGSLQERV